MLDNRSGATYRDARLKLVAGDVNLVSGRMIARRNLGYAAAEMSMDSVMPVEESFAEYHLYTILRRTTIKDNQSKQVSLLSATGVGVTKLYEYRGNTSFYGRRIMPSRKQDKVAVFLKFENKEENNLGTAASKRSEQ